MTPTALSDKVEEYQRTTTNGPAVVVTETKPGRTWCIYCHILTVSFFVDVTQLPTTLPPTQVRSAVL
jgi:hypothetical protein